MEGNTRPISSRLVPVLVLAALFGGVASAGDPAPPAPAAGTAVAPAAAVAPGPRPDGTDFVVLADGTVLTGKVSESDDAVTVDAGGKRTFGADEVSLAVSGGERIHKGSAAGIWRAWKAHLGPVPPAEVAPAEAPPVGAAEPPKPVDPAAPPAPPVPTQAELRAKWWADVLAAADRCAEWKQKDAACALLAEGLAAGTWDEEAQRRAIEWEPLAFPFSPEDEVRGKLVAEWAQTLVPLDGVFVLKTDAAWGGNRSQLWIEDAVAVRTKNLILFTLDRDRRVVDSILRQAEMTVLGLEKEIGRPESSPGPMEVRIYRNRQEYLTESDGMTGFAAAWSAGFFSPAEHVSRFYVTRYVKKKAKGKDGGAAPAPAAPAEPEAEPEEGAFVEGELHEVLSHELTHHWIEMRFCAGAQFEGVGDTPGMAGDSGKGGRGGDQPGHWIVEGIARYIEDQAILFSKRGLRFDEARAECVVSAAEASRAGMSIPIARYVDITPKEFQFLSDVPKLGRIGSGKDSKPYFNTERGVFYDQGGALAFFMMNRRGPEGRKLLIRYLKDQYGGRMPKESWKQLGFASAADLEKAFTEFLRTVR